MLPSCRGVATEQVTDRRERQAEDRAGQIDVMPRAVRLAPSHAWEEPQTLAQMSDGDREKSDRANSLQPPSKLRAAPLSSRAPDEQEHGDGDCGQRSEEAGAHDDPYVNQASVCSGH